MRWVQCRSGRISRLMFKLPSWLNVVPQILEPSRSSTKIFRHGLACWPAIIVVLAHVLPHGRIYNTLQQQWLLPLASRQAHRTCRHVGLPARVLDVNFGYRHSSPVFGWRHHLRAKWLLQVQCELKCTQQHIVVRLIAQKEKVGISVVYGRKLNRIAITTARNVHCDPTFMNI